MSESWVAFLVEDDCERDIGFAAVSVEDLTRALERLDDYDAGERFVLRQAKDGAYTGAKVEWRKPWRADYEGE